MCMENHLNYINWPPLNVTIFNTHMRYLGMGATQCCKDSSKRTNICCKIWCKIWFFIRRLRTWLDFNICESEIECKVKRKNSQKLCPKPDIQRKFLFHGNISSHKAGSVTLFGPRRNKISLRVSTNARLKQVSLATQTSLKIWISPLASLGMILYKMWITKALISLHGLCHCCLYTPETGFLALRPISEKKHLFLQI